MFIRSDVGALAAIRLSSTAAATLVSSPVIITSILVSSILIAFIPTTPTAAATSTESRRRREHTAQLEHLRGNAPSKVSITCAHKTSFSLFVLTKIHTCMQPLRLGQHAHPQ